MTEEAQTPKASIQLSVLPYADGSGGAFEVHVCSIGIVSITQGGDEIRMTEDEWKAVKYAVDGCISAQSHIERYTT